MNNSASDLGKARNKLLFEWNFWVRLVPVALWCNRLLSIRKTFLHQKMPHYDLCVTYLLPFYHLFCMIEKLRTAHYLFSCKSFWVWTELCKYHSVMCIMTFHQAIRFQQAVPLNCFLELEKIENKINYSKEALPLEACWLYCLKSKLSIKALFVW